MSREHAFLIAAPQSGSGKTTVSLAIMAAFSQRGLAVAPFKCGPDFIDPGYHTLITGHPSINLDAWMCPPQFVADTFRHHTTAADIAVIEGVMGLFDGLGSATMSGSSAQIAAITGAPVVLVVNARGMAASAAALVNGFACFDPRVSLAGVIFNNVGSTNHAMLLRETIDAHCPGVACYGCIPRDVSLSIPSRHLGLTTVEDNPLPPEFVARLADLAEQHLDLERLMALGFDSAQPAECTTSDCGDRLVSSEPSVRIAVARDAAFCFCYEDNLRLLREAGAEITFFSPLGDSALPPDICGVYLPGGYPELYAEQLGNNVAMKAAIRNVVEADMPVYAECGGFVYLTEGMEDGADFAGIFPVRARMLAQRKSLGYRHIRLRDDAIIGAVGTNVRGHEFHYSETTSLPRDISRCYHVTRSGEELPPEGYRYRNCLASYVHLHFGAAANLAGSLITACTSYRTMLQA